MHLKQAMEAPTAVQKRQTHELYRKGALLPLRRAQTGSKLARMLMPFVILGSGATILPSGDPLAASCAVAENAKQVRGDL